MEQTPYTYSELFKLKFFSCCLKRTARTDKYKEQMDIIAERMDVATIIKNESYISTMSQVLIEPHQRKLISYFKKQNDGETIKVLMMPITVALETLFKKRADQDVPKIEATINDFLLQIVESDASMPQAIEKAAGMDQDKDPFQSKEPTKNSSL